VDVIFYLFTLADGSLFGGISIEIWSGLSFASSIRFLRKGIGTAVCQPGLGLLHRHARESEGESECVSDPRVAATWSW